MKQAASNKMGKESFDHLISQEIIVIGGYSYWNKFKKLSVCLLDRKWIVWCDGKVVNEFYEATYYDARFARGFALERYNEL